MKMRAMPTEPTPDMITAAYMLIETMPKGTDARHKRIVNEVWKTMCDAAPEAQTSGMTRRQRECHQAIADLINETGMSPSYAEIGERMGKKKNDVLYLVHRLRRRGILTFRDGYKRSIRLLVQPGESKS